MCFWQVQAPMLIPMDVHTGGNQRSTSSVVFSSHSPWLFWNKVSHCSTGWLVGHGSVLWVQVHAAISQFLMWALQINFTGYHVLGNKHFTASSSHLQPNTHSLFNCVSPFGISTNWKGNMNQSTIIKKILSKYLLKPQYVLTLLLGI